MFLSNIGSEFENEKVKKFWKRVESTISADTPRSNTVERINQTLKNMIVSFIYEHYYE